MGKRITIIDGHPDGDPVRFCHVLADAYAAAALAAGHEVRRLKLADLDIPFVRNKAEWEQGEPPPQIRACQDAIAFAQHLVIVYPLWLGDMPALLKAFFEQIGRPGFAISPGERTLSPGLLKGRSARIIVTMGMPAFVYRWFFFAHSLRSLKRNILKFCGIGPIRDTIIGAVDGNADKRASDLRHIAALGSAGA